MYNFIFQAHSGWRWIVLLIVVITTLKVLIGWLASQNWSRLDSNLIRLSNIALAIQVLLGIILYVLFLSQGRDNVVAFTGSHVVPALLSLGGVGFALARSRKVQGAKNKFKFASIGMLIAIILIYGALATVGGIFA